MIKNLVKVIVGSTATLVFAAAMSGEAKAFPRVGDETHASVGYAEDSLPQWATWRLEAGSLDYQGTSPEINDWARAADPLDRHHHGCVALVGDTSYVLCPDGFVAVS